jgi:hypothetical protein
MIIKPQWKERSIRCLATAIETDGVVPVLMDGGHIASL